MAHPVYAVFAEFGQSEIAASLPLPFSHNVIFHTHAPLPFPPSSPGDFLSFDHRKIAQRTYDYNGSVMMTVARTHARPPCCTLYKRKSAFHMLMYTTWMGDGGWGLAIVSRVFRSGKISVSVRRAYLAFSLFGC